MIETPADYRSFIFFSITPVSMRFSLGFSYTLFDFQSRVLNFNFLIEILFSLFTFHFHFSLFTFHFSLFTFHIYGVPLRKNFGSGFQLYLSVTLRGYRLYPLRKSQDNSLIESIKNLLQLLQKNYFCTNNTNCKDSLQCIFS